MMAAMHLSMIWEFYAGGLEHNILSNKEQRDPHVHYPWLELCGFLIRLLFARRGATAYERDAQRAEGGFMCIQTAPVNNEDNRLASN